MPLEDNKYLVFKEEEKTELKHSGNKLVLTVRKLLTDIEKINKDIDTISHQKNDTANLKNSYKQFVEDYNANSGIITARLNAIEELLKQTVSKINELEDF